MAGAPLGNQNGLKLKTLEQRKRAYDKLCEWLAMGKVKDSFVFEEDGITAVYKTVMSYIEEDPIEFPPIKLKAAISKGLTVWETEVENCAKGKNKAANVAALQMLMRNKFGWDREEKKTDTQDKVADLKAHALHDEEIRKQIQEQNKP